MILAVIILAAMPLEGPPPEQVDLIELNHYFDCDGKQVFSQWIFWDYQGSRYCVVAWRLASDRFSFEERKKLLLWTEGMKLRQIRGECWRETWTQIDPELEDRAVLEKHRRRGLFGVKE